MDDETETQSNGTPDVMLPASIDVCVSFAYNCGFSDKSDKSDKRNRHKGGTAPNGFCIDGAYHQLKLLTIVNVI